LYIARGDGITDISGREQNAIQERMRNKHLTLTKLKNPKNIPCKKIKSHSSVLSSQFKTLAEVDEDE
jgi:hypothetical protein